jgi:hypothetical protein
MHGQQNFQVKLSWLIKMDRSELGWEHVDWIHLTQDSAKWQELVVPVMALRASQNAGNFLAGCGPLGFSRRTWLCGVISQTCFNRRLRNVS